MAKTYEQKKTHRKGHMAHDNYMTVQEAAVALGVKPDWVYKLIAAKKLTAIQPVKRDWLITRESVKARKQATK